MQHDAKTPGIPSGIQARLTGRGAKGIHCRVKPLQLFQFAAAVMMAVGSLHGQDGPPPLAPLPPIPVEGGQAARVISAAAPPEVIAAASAAVANLGAEVVLGHYQVAVDRMNPLWKKRTAERMGGMDKLENQLKGVAQQMVQQGISMISFKPEGQPRSYDVGAGKTVGVVNDEVVFNQWMVLVPTVTKFRITRPSQKTIIIESIGFQVAIADKGKDNWTFIDGSGLSVNELRGLYLNLPQDMQLPPVEKREVR